MKKLIFKIKMFFFKKELSAEENYIKLQKVVQELNEGWKPNWEEGFNPKYEGKGLYLSSKEMAEYVCKDKKFIEIYKNILIQNNYEHISAYTSKQQKIILW